MNNFVVVVGVWFVFPFSVFDVLDFPVHVSVILIMKMLVNAAIASYTYI